MPPKTSAPMRLESGANDMELLTVFVGNQSFGLNVAKVQSIQQYDPGLVTALPEAPPGVLGMYLYRNSTIPLMDLSEILNVDVSLNSNRDIVVITEFNNAVNSFKVQGVKQIYRLSWKDFVPMDALFEDNPCFTGSIHVDGAQVLVLDLEYILAAIFPELILEAVDQALIEKKSVIPRDQIHILFAEDSPTMRKKVTAVLKDAGFSHIDDFINGEEALTHIKTYLWNKDKEEIRKTVLITDIEMPIVDGLTLCRTVKKDSVLKGIYVVMFSSLINSQMKAKCGEAQAEDLVMKPETSELIKILDNRCRLD